MTKVVIRFEIFQASEDGIASDMHTRNFEFKGTFDEAKKFLDEVMYKRIEVQNKEATEKLPY